MKRSPSKSYQSSLSIKSRSEESMEKIKNGCPEYVELLYNTFLYQLCHTRALRTMRKNKLSSLPQCK